MSKKEIFVKPKETELLPIVNQILTRSKIKEFLKESEVTLYWRLLTPLVLVWCFIYQRLSKDHSCDGVVSHLHAGGADKLDIQDKNPKPLSQRLSSESTSAYVQGRNRLPLSVLEKVLHLIYTNTLKWLKDDQQSFKGHFLRFLDGTTIRLRPFGDLQETYGNAKNQHGKSYWIISRVLAAFCLHTEALVAAAEADSSTSEPALVADVMKNDPQKDSIYIADQKLGVYRTIQTAKAFSQKVVLRIQKKSAKYLWKKSSTNNPLVSGFDHLITWKPASWTKVDESLEANPIVGRLIYIRIQQKGFRPKDIYLFTTLASDEFSFEDICELYSLRWQVEIDLRSVKTTLEMEQLEVKSSLMFKKELIAGFITYNLIRAFMVKSAIKACIDIHRLSFSKCLRRIRDILTLGVPQWVKKQDSILSYLLERLAKCKLPNQPKKVKHEPRKVRRKPAVFPQLRGSREDARKEVLSDLAA